MASRTTLKAVAAAAGVSVATASYAFSRPDRLSADARSKVLAAARELGYAGPDAAARTLRTGHAGAVGVILTVDLAYAFSDPYVVELLGGIAESLTHDGASMVLIPSGAHGAWRGAGSRDSVDAVNRAVIDGAIADGLPEDHPAVRVLDSRGLPLVRSRANSAGPWVAIDDHGAGRSVGAHLAEHGHRDVAVVVASPAPPGRPVGDDASLYPYSRDRLLGIREGLGASARVQVYSGGRNDTTSGRAAAEVILAGPRRPTAIAADSDALALAVLDTVRESGRTVGRDLTVTGFDDIATAAAAGLTTVRQPIRTKGRLMGRIALGHVGTQNQVLLPTELVVRSSSGPAPHRQEGQ